MPASAVLSRSETLSASLEHRLQDIRYPAHLLLRAVPVVADGSVLSIRASLQETAGEVPTMDSLSTLGAVASTLVEFAHKRPDLVQDVGDFESPKYVEAIVSAEALGELRATEPTPLVEMLPEQFEVPLAKAS